MPFTVNRPTSWELKEILEGDQLQRDSYIDEIQEFTALMGLHQEDVTEDKRIYDDSVGCLDNSIEELYEEVPAADFFDCMSIPEVQQQDKSKTDTKVIFDVYEHTMIFICIPINYYALYRLHPDRTTRDFQI